ncbi:helix-turn-helix transcriptional regulator [Aestuariispira ectoiniformans]|uniref:helix-turn-helix transcriptional regulator n=1 Tax=Aestuariispira ectoiniformans TaxID=2775080 RepID=UPI00223BF787|nr:YafY family protein [Aestuariispira ectoiniformans]
MRRADRLFEIIQILRRRRSITTAQQLAEELEVSVRTVYRDIAALQAQRVPIEGEAGVGYVFREGFDLPPLMFNEEEIESLVLGARITETWADPELARAARDVLAKVAAVLPPHLRPQIMSMGLAAPTSASQVPVDVDLARVRRCIREKKKIALSYCDEKGDPSERIIWPLTLAFFGPVWNIIGWCELRNDFRAFRPDRMIKAEFLDAYFPDQPGRRLVDYLKRMGMQPKDL